MQIFTELNENKNLSLALGYFDGVHKGHKAVISSAVDFAKNNGNKSAVITFKDHPCCFFYGVCPKYILSRENRIKYIEELGIDYLYMLDFKDICDITGEQYIKNVLIKYFSPTSISTGFNHNFGKDKSGNTKLLKEYSKQYGYKFFEISPQKYNNEAINSTAIRNLLFCGEIEKANEMLTHKFSITGEIVEGDKIGRTIGFNTANINYPQELIDIPFGAYSTEAIFKDKIFKSISNFGIKPTIKGTHLPVLETHILNFDDDIYGQTIQVNFNKMLRKEQKFSSLDELQQQIKLDISNL
ncbi:MAG: bifunctional riboflavin kinase/FAD synthetase [Clostridiaceae bacterium]|nr:bifunctional riboflavin kinase/FAD synthetase [Clostridiaceae bacterium]